MMLADLIDFFFRSPTFLIFGSYTVAMVIALALLLHPQQGLAGIGNFGIAGFWGIGLYTFGILTVKHDIPFVLALAIATLAAGVAGLLIGWIISDLDPDGVLGVTLAFAGLVYLAIESERDITGAHLGLGTIDFPVDFGARTDLAWLAILVLLDGLLLAYMRHIHRAPYGRLLIAIGSNEPLARSLRKPVKRTKIILMGWTSAGMGMIGALYGPFVHFLLPTQLTVAVTVAVIVALILGGQQRPWGAIVGAVATIALFDIVIKLYVPLPRSALQQAFPVAKEMVFGGALVLVLLFRPHGVLGPMRRDRDERRRCARG